ncbi:MAG TPA: type III-A CRISPR-associated protein Cas10/Csm1 [bacterium]|nr:type III-A CRISPR-associated protein Cas10/Csm1 [bacterium]
MNRDYEILTLAALLHDVGKFVQRANYYESKNFSEEEKSRILPQKDGRSTHIHAFFTWKFLKDEFPWPDFLKNDAEEIAETAGQHHNGYRKEFLEACVKWGDTTASAHERTPDYEEKYSSKLIGKTPLNSPFKLIEGDFGGDNGLKIQKLSLVKLENLEQSENAIYEKDYLDHFNHFKKGLKDIQNSSSFNEYMLKLLTVLEEFWWCIPSAVYETEPDVSLFEHSRLTALLAETFYLYFKGIGHDTDSWISKHPDEEFFKIVSGDISGIQNFIFGLSKSSDKNGSKLIRGRSFFVQALSKSLVLGIQKRLNLSPLSTLLDAGGNFSIIIPALDEYTVKLNSYVEEIEEYFFTEFCGEIYPAISISDGFAIDDFKNKYNYVIKNVRHKNEAKKRSKFRSLFKKGVFSISLNEKSYEGAICTACEKHPAAIGTLCKICSNSIKIGEQLGRGVKSIAYLEGAAKNDNEFEIIPEIKILLSNDNKWEDSFIYVENEDETGVYFPKSNTVSYLPRDNSGNPLTLEDISEETDKGRNFLSLFKSDVDSLGLVFSKKVYVKKGDQKQTSISHNTAVSRAITLFWGRLLKDFIKRKYGNIYIVFAGGDDVALIGNYEDILNFSIDIQKHFCKYSMNKLTFSAGIFNFKNSFPVKKALLNAEELLDESKNYGDSKKNKVTVFNETLSWQELTEAKEFAEFIYQKVTSEKIGIGFWYRFFVYWKNSKNMRTSQKYNQRDLLTISHSTYDINKNIKDEFLKKELDIYRAGLCASDNHKKRLVGLQYGIGFSRNIGGKKDE